MEEAFPLVSADSSQKAIGAQKIVKKVYEF
jgi:hypothetical protein